MSNKSNIRFVLPHHGWNFRYITNAGFEVCDPYVGNSLIPRIFREIYFRLNLPCKFIWYNQENLLKDKTIFVYEPLIIPDYLRWLHEKTDNCRIILFYANPVFSSVNPNLINDDWCEKWTADVVDAKEYGINWYNGGGYFTQWKVEKTEPIYDVFYVGKDKGRLEKIQALQGYFENHGLKTYFHITAERRFQRKKKKCYQPFMQYEQVSEILGKTKAILHLSNGCQKGITIRIAESLIHGIKLITDDQDIVNCDFYSDNNIFVLGLDNMNRLPEFLNAPYIPVESLFYEHPYFEDMVRIVTGIDVGEK